MTAVARSDATPARRRVNARADRVVGLLRTEARLLWRFQVVTATVGVTALWVVILRSVPAATRGILVPVVLLTDVTALGFLFIPALLVLERIEGVAAAMRMTPVRPLEQVAVRLGMTTALSLIAAVAVCTAGGVADIAPRLLGVGTLSLLFGLVAFALSSGAATLTTFLLRAPLVAAPLVAPALIWLTGLTDAPVLHVSPVTSAVDLLRGDIHVVGAGWQILWIIALTVVVARLARRPVAQSVPPASAVADRAAPVGDGVQWLPRRRDYSAWLAMRSFARVDRRVLLRDGLLVLLAASVPLLAVVMRVVATAGVAWTRARTGVELAAYLPLIEALILVVHIPVILGSLAGLLLLEDRDAGLFGPLRATRASLTTLLGYRLGATALCAATALLVTLPFDGVGHPSGAGGVVATAVAASVVSVVPALAMAAVATNRVQGVAVMKLLGLPLYLPLATWAVAAPASWLAAPLPTAWLVQAAWAPSPVGAVGFALGAAFVSAAWSVPLARRFLRHATRA